MAYQQDRGFKGNNMFNMIETATGMDLNGDGKIGSKPMKPGQHGGGQNYSAFAGEAAFGAAVTAAALTAFGGVKHAPPKPQNVGQTAAPPGYPQGAYQQGMPPQFPPGHPMAKQGMPPGMPPPMGHQGSGGFGMPPPMMHQGSFGNPMMGAPPVAGYTPQMMGNPYGGAPMGGMPGMGMPPPMGMPPAMGGGAGGFCGGCGAMRPAGQKFCGSCGRPA